MPTSPPQPIRDESLFQLRFSWFILPRLRRAHRAGFEQLAPQLQARNLKPISIDGGSTPSFIGNLSPNLAFRKADDITGEGANPCPGNLRISWKWKSVWRASPDQLERREHRQALSQMHFYMKQYHIRYGFFITDTELVLIQRLPENGHIALADAFPRTSQGDGQLTVLLRL